MTRKELLWRAEAMLVRLLIAGVRRLGPATASHLGGAVARTIGPLLPVNRVGDANLRMVMPELDTARRREILRSVWDMLGRTAAELPHLRQLRRTDSGPGWEIEGEAVLHGLVASGGPSILFSGHLGNWEMLPAMGAHFGIAISSFYRAPANKEVDDLIIALRRDGTAMDVPNFAKGAKGARAALVHLSRGGHLGMLIDQKMNDGIEAQLFGRPAMTAPAAAAFALRLKCPLLPAHVQRIGPARFRLVVEPYLPLPDTGDRQADILTLTNTINQKLEQWIRERPGEWLWLHRRWPR